MTHRVDRIFSGKTVEWAKSETWVEAISIWLSNRLTPAAFDSLKNMDTNALYDDDPEWRDILTHYLKQPFEEIVEELSEAITYAKIRTFHGCRTEDALMYFNDGLRVHKKEELKAQAQKLIDHSEDLKELQPQLDQRIDEVNNQTDEGRCHVVLDERPLLEYAAHYLIYGSEWISAILGPGSWPYLQKIGTPTMLEIDLPLNIIFQSTRDNLADLFLREWTRQKARNPKEVLSVDFTFIVPQNIAPEHISGHYHPAELKDPYSGNIFRSETRYCAYCDPSISAKT